MKRTWVTCLMAAAVIGWTGAIRTVEAQVTACQPPNCAEVKLVPQSLQAHPGQTVTVSLNFTQAPSDGKAGGPDETAALALSIGMGTGTGAPPFKLADCTPGSDGLPASVHPNAVLSNPPGFKLVVENAYCANGRTHCLCPDAGGPVADSFINLVIYGPNPLPAPGPQPIDIPTLPAGPQDLLAIDLLAQSGAIGDVQLHLYNQVQETQAPEFRALLSIGDKVAVDQTCVPKSGQPPCSSGSGAGSGGAAAGPVSQVVTADSTIALSAGCAGDCNGDDTVNAQDLAGMVSVALGGTSGCPGGPETITVDQIVAAVKAWGPCS